MGVGERVVHPATAIMMVGKHKYSEFARLLAPAMQSRVKRAEWSEGVSNIGLRHSWRQVAQDV